MEEGIGEQGGGFSHHVAQDSIGERIGHVEAGVVGVGVERGTLHDLGAVEDDVGVGEAPGEGMAGSVDLGGDEGEGEMREEGCGEAEEERMKGNEDLRDNANAAILGVLDNVLNVLGRVGRLGRPGALLGQFGA